MISKRRAVALFLTLIALAGCGRVRSEQDLKAAYLPQSQILPIVQVYSETVPNVKPGSFFIECVTVFDSEIRKDRREAQVVRALEACGWVRTLAPEKADVIIGWRTVEGRYSEQLNIVSRPITGISYDKYVGFYSTYLGTVTETQRDVSYLYGLTLIGTQGQGKVHSEVFFLNSVVSLSRFEPEDYVPLVIVAVAKSIGLDASRGSQVRLLETDRVLSQVMDKKAQPLLSDMVNTVIRNKGSIAVEGLSGEPLSIVEAELSKIGIALDLNDSSLKLVFSKNNDEGALGKLLNGDQVLNEFAASKRMAIGGFDTGEPVLNCLANLILR